MVLFCRYRHLVYWLRFNNLEHKYLVTAQYCFLICGYTGMHELNLKINLHWKRFEKQVAVFLANDAISLVDSYQPWYSAVKPSRACSEKHAWIMPSKLSYKTLTNSPAVHVAKNMLELCRQSSRTTAVHVAKIHAWIMQSKLSYKTLLTRSCFKTLMQSL